MTVHSSFIRAVLASTVFCLFPLSAYAITNLDAGANGQNSGNPAYPPTTGYQYIINNITFTQRNGDALGNTAGISVFSPFFPTDNNTFNFAGASVVSGGILEVNTVNLQGGAGKIVQLADPTAIFTPTNINFTADGTLALANGTFIGSAIITTNIDNTSGTPGIGTLRLDGSATVWGSIGATNSLKLIQMNASGSTLTLNNPLVNAQLINLNSTNVVSANLSLNNGNTLQNNGTSTITGNLIVNNGGILSLSPNSPLAVTGNFTSAAGSTLQFDLVDIATTTSVVAVGGTATTNVGTKINILNPGYLPNAAPINLITSVNAPTYNSPLVVTPSSLLTSFTTQVAGNNLQLVRITRSVAANTNQSNTNGIAGALDAIARSTPPAIGLLGNIITNLSDFTDQATLTEALAELAPNVSGAQMYESFQLQQYVGEAIGNRLDEYHHRGYAAGDNNEETYGTWVKVFGEHADQSERDNIDGYKDNMWGVAGGIDAMITDNALLGLALSWATADVHYKIPGGGETDIDSYQATLYGKLYFNCPLYVDWFGAVAYNNYDNERNVNFSNLFFSPSGDTHGWQYGAKGEAGYVFGQEAFHTILLASLYYSHLNIDSYTETGAGTASQTVDDSNFDMLQAGLGIKFAYDCAHGKTLFQPEVHLKAFYDFIGDKFETTSQFAGAGPSFTTTGFKPAQDSYNIGGSISAFLSGITFTASYDFGFKEDYSSSTGFIRLLYNW